jgi:hypothetical protein
MRFRPGACTLPVGTLAPPLFTLTTTNTVYTHQHCRSLLAALLRAGQDGGAVRIPRLGTECLIPQLTVCMLFSCVLHLSDLYVLV